MGTAVTLMSAEQITKVVSDAVAKTMEELMPKQEPQPKQADLLTDKQLQEKLGVSRITLYEMRRKQSIPYRKIGGKILYDYDEVLSSMNKYGDKKDEK